MLLFQLKMLCNVEELCAECYFVLFSSEVISDHVTIYVVDDF